MPSFLQLPLTSVNRLEEIQYHETSGEPAPRCRGRSRHYLLHDLESGRREAFDRLLVKVYPALRDLAHAKLRNQRAGLTLNTTGLVHEAYLKMVRYQDVECRYFAGLTIEETAEVLGISHGTVSNDWRLARAWLKCELSE